MFKGHYIPLVIAYLTALGGWLLFSYYFRDIWPKKSDYRFDRPGKEFGIAIVGAIAVIGMGRLWSMGIRLPEEGALGPVLASVNQVLIFAPILLVPVLRKQPWTTAWLPRQNIPKRLLAGLTLAIIAVTVYSQLRINADAPWYILGRTWQYEHIDAMVQVFLEDTAIAILFVRLASAIGKRWATVVVACLFAAGHIPVMLSEGASLIELAGLLRDAGLGVAVILVLQRSRDIVWFWCIHFCLDMTQFPEISGIG